MTRRPFLIGVCLLGAFAFASCSGSKQGAAGFLKSGDAYVQDKKYSEAVIEYSRAVQADGKSAEARTKLADAYVQVGDLKNAYKQYIYAADLAPDDPLAQMRAGNMLLAANQFEEAKGRAEKILARRPNYVDAQILKANALAGLHKLGDALKEVEDAIKNDPNRSASYASLGSLNLATGNPQEAEAAFKKAVASDPKSVPARLALSHYYWVRGQRENAERELKAAVDLDPKNLESNRALAYFYLGYGEQIKAEPYLKVVADVSPDASGKLILADYYLSISRTDETRKILELLAADEKDKDGSAAAKLRLAGLGASSKPAEANRLIDEVLSKQPHNVDALLAKSQMLMAAGKPDAALDTARTAVTSNPRSASAYFALGRLLALRHDDAEAIEAFTEALKLNPRMATAEVELATLYFSAQQFDQAEQMARSATTKVSGYIQAHLLLARIYLIQRNAGKAEPSIRGLVKVLPDSPAVQAELGQLELLKGNRPAARTAFQRALSKNPAQIDAVGGLVAMDMQEKHPDAAKAHLDTAVRAAPKNGELLTFAGRSYAALGDFKTAERLALDAIQADANNADAYSILGQIYASQNRLDEALAEFTKLADKRPKSAGIQTVIGVLLRLQKKNAEARKSYEKALALDPHAGVAANNLAVIQLEGGNLDAALQLAQTARASLPNEAEVADTLGWIYCKKNLFSLAVQPLQQAVLKGDKNPIYHYHLGTAYAGTGDRAKARAELQQALALDPNFSGAADAKATLEKLKR